MIKYVLLLSFYCLWGSVVLCQERFKVGILHPLTGPLAEYGTANENAIKLALEQNPEIAKRIEFVFEDNAGDNARTVNAFNKLVQFDQVKLLWVWGFGPVQAVAPLAEARHIPLLAVSAERTISIGRKYIIRFNFFAEQIGDALATYLRRQGFKRYAIIKSEQPFLDSVSDGFLGSLKPGEAAEILDNYMLQDQDFLPSILKARKQKFDAVGVLLWPGQISRFYRQLQTVGGGLRTFGPHTFESYTEMKDANGAMEGAIFGVMNVDIAFHQLYLKRFGADNRISFAASAYDFANITGKLFDGHSNKLTPDEILAAYRGLPAQRGATGEFKYVDTPYEGPSFSFPIQVKRIEGQKIVNIK